MGNYDFFKNIQVITPTKKGLLGTKDLNRALQEKLNPASERKAEKSVLGTIFRVGDKVMQVKNNYDIYWEKKSKSSKDSISENGTGVFNGELGIIEKIDDLEKQIKVKFDDDKIVWYQYAELDQLENAYAITVHKAQRKRIRCSYNTNFSICTNVINPKLVIYWYDKSKKTSYYGWLFKCD
jgi:exodeoxyribonuclease V alpha subunit